MGQGRDSPSDKSLSLTSLVIGSASSAAAAVVVHSLWEPGTIIGAAMTPLLMSLFAEALRRPVERVTVRTSSGDPGHMTFEVHRPARRWRQAVLAGLAAFALGAAGLTASELLLQRAIADGEGDTTLFGTAAQPTPTSTPARTSTPAPASPTAAPTATPDGRSTPTPTPTATARTQPTPSPTPTPTPTPTPAAPAPSPP